MSKAQTIRDALKANPTLTPKEIADKLGGGVTGQYVSLIRYQDKKSAGKKSGKRKARKTAATVARTVKANTEVSLARHGDPQLGHAYIFAQACGGISNAVETLKTLESLQVK